MDTHIWTNILPVDKYWRIPLPEWRHTSQCSLPQI